MVFVLVMPVPVVVIIPPFDPTAVIAAVTGSLAFFALVALTLSAGIFILSLVKLSWVGFNCICVIAWRALGCAEGWIHVTPLRGL